MTVLSLSVVTPLFAATMIEAQSQLGSPSSKTVRGEVAAVEGEFHMAKNSLGEDILKMVDKSYVLVQHEAASVADLLVSWMREVLHANRSSLYNHSLHRSP